MQVLPFIFSFLLFFSISLTYFFEDIKDNRVLFSSLKSFFEASWNLENLKQEHLYKSTEKFTQKMVPAKPNESDAKKRKNTRKTAKTNSRHLKDKNHQRIYFCSQLNLYPLFKQGKELQKQRFILFARLLKNFYPDFLSPKKAEFLISKLIEKSKPLLEKDQSLDLKKIDLSDEKLQMIFYQMLKSKICFLDYIKIDAKDSKICLAKCPFELLSALMGKKRAEQMLQLRKLKQWNKAQAEKIYFQKKDEIEFKNFYVISHSKHKKNCLLLATEPKKNTVLRKQL